MTTQLLKRIHFLKFISTFPPLNPGSLLMAVFCSFLIVIATFTPIPLKVISLPPEAIINPQDFFANFTSFENISSMLIYIPQMPVIILIAGILGPGLGLLSTFIYVVAGLAGLPVFASGGGIEYFSRFSFGYILGFFSGVLVTGKMINSNKSRPNILKASIIGIITIHLVGILYLAGTFLLTQESFSSLFNWIWQLSGTQILYDILFGIIAVFLGRLIRIAIWLVTD